VLYYKQVYFSIQFDENLSRENRKKKMSQLGKPSSTFNNFQCSLHGEVKSSVVPELLNRLVGLCNTPLFTGEENLFRHEIAFLPTRTYSRIYFPFSSL